MTARDKYGHTSVKDKDGKVLFDYYYSENDGWTLKNRGFETDLEINFGTCTIDDLTGVLPSLPKDVYTLVSGMIVKGKLVSGSYRQPEPDFSKR
ncbi:MAG: hypothetical protein U9R08_01455 [Nanoarchaeota archaeon]|nr:hypothetical protein [Nanoarchaeota archaeon]